MARKIIFGSIWLAFVLYAIFLAPAAGGQETLDLIINLCLIKWQGINPIIIAIFYIMGVFPWIYAAFILFDSPGQKISAYPFFIASIGFGAFALLPYFAFRKPNTTWNGEKNQLLRVLDSRLMAMISSITIVVFIFWGLIKGDWLDFIAQWETSQFIHIMSLDFCLLCLLFLDILQDDMERRGIKQNHFFWLAGLIPLFGALVYWCLRPQLPEIAAESAT